jgi:hypothetical protein
VLVHRVEDGVGLFLVAHAHGLGRQAGVIQQRVQDACAVGTAAESHQVDPVAAFRAVVAQQEFIGEAHARRHAQAGAHAGHIGAGAHAFDVQGGDVGPVLERDDRVQLLDVGVGDLVVVRAVEEDHQLVRPRRGAHGLLVGDRAAAGQRDQQACGNQKAQQELRHGDGEKVQRRDSAHNSSRSPT